MILQIAVNSPLRRCFDYLPPLEITRETLARLQKGVRIRVPFRNKAIVGILVGISNTSTVSPKKLKAAIEILDEKPLFSPEIFELLLWASDYYQHPLGEVFSAALPGLLRKGRLFDSKMPCVIEDMPAGSVDAKLILNAEQTQVIEIISQAMHQFGVYLLNGVTGSGKTEVYWRLIEKTMERQKQTLILVPEIGLTPQLSQRLQTKLQKPIVVMHSGLSEKERLDAWRQAKAGAPVVIGTRSGIFTQLANPGLIVVDEEHDVSFKQQEGFRYSARDVAIMRAQKENIPIVLGSATPSLESLLNVEKMRYVPLSLPKRAGFSVMPRFQVIDIRAKSLKNGVSSVLLEAIERHLAENQQVILFLNRRGYAPVLLCHACGWIAMCRRCDARLTLHKLTHDLICHHCSFSRKMDTNCQQCGSEALLHVGLGTERIETLLKKHFPKATIARLDRDTTRRKGALNEMLLQAQEGHSQILIGTQMLAKGHHFPNVTLVGILDMDGGFFSADFRATERMAQLIMQVSGRAGRESTPGEVYLQTHQPNHPLLGTLLREGYSSFAASLLKERQATQLPPCTYLALFRAESVKAEAGMQFLKTIAEQIKKIMGTKVNILGPVPSPMEKKAGRYRAQLLLRAPQRAILKEGLTTLLKEIEQAKVVRNVRWSLDIDPLEMF